MSDDEESVAWSRVSRTDQLVFTVLSNPDRVGTMPRVNLDDDLPRIEEITEETRDEDTGRSHDDKAHRPEHDARDERTSSPHRHDRRHEDDRPRHDPMPGLYPDTSAPPSYESARGMRFQDFAVEPVHYDDPAPYAPHDPAPHTPPRHSAPHDSAPHDSAPHDSAPHEPAPHEPARAEPVPHEPAPHEPARAEAPDGPRRDEWKAYESREEDELAKRSLLLDLQQLRLSRGVELSREWTMNDRMDDMMLEMRRLTLALDEQTNVGMMRDGMRLFVTGVEMVNTRFGLLDLEGWSAEVCRDLHKQDANLARIYRKYWRRSVSNTPEWDVAASLIGSAGLHHMKRTMSKQMLSRAAPVRPPARGANPSAGRTRRSTTELSSSSDEEEEPPSSKPR